MDFKNLMQPPKQIEMLPEETIKDVALPPNTDKWDTLLAPAPDKKPFKPINHHTFTAEEIAPCLIEDWPKQEPLTGVLKIPEPPRLLTPSDQGWHKEMIPNIDRMCYLSNSKIKTLFESERAFYRRYILGIQPKDTPAKKKGRIVHSALLEPADFKRRYVIEPEFSGKGSKAAAAEWYAMQEPDAIILTEEEATSITYMIESVYSHKKANAILTGSTCELKGYVFDEATDWWWLVIPDAIFASSKGLLFSDVKTTQCADAREFGKDYFNYGYYIQEAVYMDMAKKLFGPKEVAPFTYIAVESSEPYITETITMPTALQEMGRQVYINMARKLKEKLAKHKEQKDWHGYSGGAGLVLGDIPRWAYSQIENDPRFLAGQ